MSEQDVDVLFTYFNEINIISQLSSTIFEQFLPDGLTQSQFSVLNWFVRVDKEATPGRLAKAFQVTPGAMTNTLKKLDSKGLIRITPDPASGRSKRITLTAKGLKVRNQSIAAAGPVLVEFADAFSKSAIARQTKQLQHVREYLDTYRYRD